jgi:guanosine-3',5'-bis(diphosphate) 3'-pyrophosphohydrolase
MTEAVRQIVSTVSTYDPAADTALIQRCFDFAAERHAGQRRRSGEPYVVHPVGVARIISDLRLDVPSVCAGLLHDCVEDTSATAEDIGRLFGQEIQFLVEGVTKLGQIPWTTREERQAENFRKMLLAMARDIRVILIKLADRVDNMRTLQHMSREKQERISSETLEIYAPLANRLGIQWMKIELEDLAFRYVEPQAYADLLAKMNDTADVRNDYIAEVVAKLKAALEAAEIPAQVSGRAKHMWSIFQKMRKTGREVEQIYDVIAFRVVVDSVRDCYGALGIVHSNWTPIPGRFKDFIALPKPNLYQSLHTTVIGPRSDRMEVQIRTQEMHRIADQGIAAHWQYKEKVPIGAGDGQAFAWLRQLMEWQRDLKDPTEFIETVKIDLFQDEVFVFTPKGDVKALPKGSTPIDFAYAIHSKVGDSCSGARINGLIVPLRYALKNGDTIDILTSPNQKPSKDWLKFVATSRAKTKIRHFIRMEQRERSRQMGHDLLARELRKRGFGLPTMERDGRVQQAAERLHVGAAEDLLVAVGYGRLTVDQAANAIAPALENEPGRARGIGAAGGQDLTVDTPLIGLRRVVKRAVGGIRVQGETDILVKFAKCCSPVPGDPIIGFISRGHGVAIHAPDCERAMALDPARRLEVSWDDESKTVRPVTVEVQADDRPGLLASISRAFTESGVNISQAKCRTSEDGKAVNTFQVAVGHVDQLKTVLRNLQGIEGVVSAARR